MTWLTAVHWVACAIVVAEALNKLERTAPFQPSLSARERLVEVLKALAWILLALGGGGGLVAPLTNDMPRMPNLGEPGLQDACLAVGFAVLIVRTRFKEG